MKEIWKDIPDYEGLYQASNLGRIKSLKTNCILKAKINNKGYFQCLLYKNKKPKSYYIHRLVAITFISNVDNYPQINHRDENKLNNNVDNLEWCNNKYNVTFGSFQKRRLETVCKRVIQKDDFGNIIKIWDNINEIASYLGYKKTTIWKVCKEHKKAYGYYWEYN